MPTKKAIRKNIFVSYSHADKKWLDLLQVHMKPMIRDHDVIMWSDRKIRGGEKWRSEIDTALLETKVAILLVSSNFLASDFISDNELPPILKAAEKEGVTIIQIIINFCAFGDSPLSKFQAMNDPGQPLNLLSEGQVDQIFNQVYKRVREIFVVKAKPISKAKSAVGLENAEKKLARATADSRKGIKETKLGKATNEITSTAKKTLQKKASPISRKAIEDHALLVKKNGEWEVIIVGQSQIGENLRLVLLPTTPIQRAFLASLRSSDELASVVFNLHTFPVRMKQLESKTENKRESWHLEATVHELQKRSEWTINNVTPDMQAQSRAKMLFINESASINDRSNWNFGSNLSTDIKGSPFPTLYQLLNKKVDAFKKIAPLVATWFLHYSNIVEHIILLNLQVKNGVLTVKFEGKRSAYHGEKPVVIKIEGTCDLSQPSQEPLLLISSNRY